VCDVDGAIGGGANTFSKAEIAKRCKKKRRNPSKRVR